MTHDPSVQTGNEVTDSVTSGTAPTPDHDPFCTRSEVPYDPWRPCYCDVIAKVRADERQRIIGVMERNADGDAAKVIDAVLDMTCLDIERDE